MDKLPNPYKTVGDSVAAARESLGLSQSAFGQLPLIAVSRATVSRWEAGRGAPDLVQVRAIEAQTGKPLD